MKNQMCGWVVLGMMLLASGAMGQKKGGAMAPVEDVAGLPRVLLIGDSISIGYTLPARAELEGVANVHRPSENCGPTRYGLEKIDEWLGDGNWDVIHFNFGLHDLKYLVPDATNLVAGKKAKPGEGVQVSGVKEYAKNLDVLVKRMKETGATLVWRTTTPVPAEGASGRVAGDSAKFNAAAAVVMKKHKVLVDDLYAWVQPRQDKLKSGEGNVHFNKETNLLFGRRVGVQVKAALKKRAGAARQRSIFDPVVDVKGLPRVLILGDSISIGYTLDVKDGMKGVANVQRAPTNCGPTWKGLENIDAWLEDGNWDVIHFNFGLHDLKFVDENMKNTSPAKGRYQVGVEEYAENLDALVTKMKATGATVIFATTTPVPDGEPQRVKGDAVVYNAAAVAVMERHGVVVNDLYGFIEPHLGEAQIQGGNVHFVAEGSAMLGGKVVKELKKAIRGR